MARKVRRVHEPFERVVPFQQPSQHLSRRIFVVHFANENGFFCGEDSFTAAENGCLGSFNVDLD
jgi:hypothetical protein